MGILRISLFGTLRAVHDDCPSAVRITPKAQGLLAYLLLHGPRRHARGRLAGLFWGDYPQERARGCLSTALWRLRRALEPEGVPRETYLLTRPADKIGFNWESQHWLDVATFERQVTPILPCPAHAMSTAQVQRLEGALCLYTGDLLEGLYDEWIIPEQERLRCLYLACLQHLMHAYKHHRLYEESLAYGRRILELEPPHEEIHREMMKIYLDSGQRALAVRQYEICREVLFRQLGVEPMEETWALYAQARDHVSHSAGEPSLQVSRNSLQRALKQLGLATRGFDDAQHGFEQASRRYQEAQHQLQRAQQLLERLTQP